MRVCIFIIFTVGMCYSGEKTSNRLVAPETPTISSPGTASYNQRATSRRINQVHSLKDPIYDKYEMFYERDQSSSLVHAIYEYSRVSQLEGLGKVLYPFYLHFLEIHSGLLEDGKVVRTMMLGMADAFRSVIAITNVGTPRVRSTNRLYANSFEVKFLENGSKRKCQYATMYFYHNHAIHRLFVTDFLSSSGDETMAKLQAWMNQIIDSHGPKEINEVAAGGKNLRIPVPRESIALPPESSKGYVGICSFVDVTEYYRLSYKLKYAMRSSDLTDVDFQRIREKLTSTFPETQAKAIALSKSRGAFSAEVPEIIENSDYWFTNSQEAVSKVDGTIVRTYSLFSYFPLNKLYVEMIVHCTFEPDTYPEIMKKMTLYSLQSWRDAILAANGE